MTQFHTGRPGRLVAMPNVSRAAREKTAGGMKWLASASRLAGSARWRSFMSPSASWVRAGAATGSATFVISGAAMSMILLP